MLAASRSRWMAAGAVVTCLSCTGVIDPEAPGAAPAETPDRPPGAGAGPGQPPAPPAGGSSPGKPDAGLTPGVAPGAGAPAAGAPAGTLLPLLRLTREQYNNTVRDLLGDRTRPADAFGEDAIGGSGFTEPGVLAVEGLRKYWNAAEDLAAAAVRDLDKLTGCPAGEGDAACAARFVRDFGKRAFRRPLEADEQTRYRDFYAAARSTLKHDHRGGIRMVLLAMLQSPHFLYRPELGAAAPVVDAATGLARLDPYQTASRLSYFLWNTMPDAALFAAADAGKLRTDAEVAQEARRMLADARAKETVESFRVQWLHVEGVPALEKASAVYKSWSDKVAASMHLEGRKFFEDVFFDGDGKLETLLTSPVAYVDKRLAPIYGVTSEASEPTRTMLDPARRAGLLTQTAFLAGHATAGESHPVKRGGVILSRLLCREIPLPDFEVPPPKPPAPGLSTRERFAEHGEAACAKACHGELDPLGFAFEHYDAVGRLRTEDAGKPVDASGAARLDGVMRPFKDGVELARLLAASEDVRRCLAQQWLRFALGRVDEAGDVASLDAAAAALSKGGGDLRELLVALTTSRSFLHRPLAPGEVTR